MRKKFISGALAASMVLSLGLNSGAYAASGDLKDRMVSSSRNILRDEDGDEETTEYEKINEEPEIIVEPTTSDVEHVDTKIPETVDRIHYIKLDDGINLHTSDAILIESNGHYGLIDASNRSSEENVPLSSFDAPNSASGVAVRNYLAALGVEHLDFILATHSHSDHLGGIPDIVKEVSSVDLIDEDSTAYDVKETLYDKDGNELDEDQSLAIEEYLEHDEDYGKDPEVVKNESHVHMVDEDTTYIYKGYTNIPAEAVWKNDVYYQAALTAMGDSVKLQVNTHVEGLDALGATFNKNGDGDMDDTISFQFGDFNISLYNLYSRSTEDENANSIVTYIEKSGCKTALLADIDVYDQMEQKIGKAITAQHGNVDVMKVGHHGFSASTSKELVDTLNPKYAIIQTISTDLDGYSPFYGYMKQKNINMYRTKDASGNAIVQDMTGKLTFNTAAVVATEPEELYRVVDTYTVTSSYANYYAEDYAEEEENVDPPVQEEQNPDQKQGGLGDGQVNGNNEEGGEGDEELDYDVKQLVEKVETVTRTRKVIKNTTLSIGSAPMGWVQSRKDGGWVKWFTDWENYDWVYVNADGSLKKGWQVINSTEASHPGNHVYFFDENGIMKTGWTTRNGKKVYLLKEDYKDRPFGSLITGWCKLDNAWYYFDGDGAVHNGWINSGGTWYYSEDGRAFNGGFKEIGGVKYYFGADCEMKTGWQKIDGEWYYLGNEGKPTSGWNKNGDKWYYTTADGKVKKNEWQDGYWLGADGAWSYQYKGSWKANSKGWWYEDESGWYPSGCWQTINGVKYYFGIDGYMASNEWVNGQWISSDGTSSYKYKGSWKVNSKGWWYEDEIGWYPRAQWQKINSVWYYFEGDGYMAANKYVDGYYVDNNGACQ